MASNVKNWFEEVVLRTNLKKILLDFVRDRSERIIYQLTIPVFF
jgi:hypothetical protein